MVARSSVGYSDKSLAGKLGIKAGVRILVLGDAPNYTELLGGLPEGAQIVSRAGASVDMAHLFTTKKAELERRLRSLRSGLRPDVAVWVSWPKKSSRVPTDITEDVIRAVALPMGWVDIKVCAVTEIWSGLKLVVRAGLR